MISLPLLLLLAAFIVLIASAIGRAPLWVAVFLILMILLLQMWPR